MSTSKSFRHMPALLELACRRFARGKKQGPPPICSLDRLVRVSAKQTTLGDSAINQEMPRLCCRVRTKQKKIEGQEH